MGAMTVVVRMVDLVVWWGPPGRGHDAAPEEEEGKQTGGGAPKNREVIRDCTCLDGVGARRFRRWLVEEGRRPCVLRARALEDIRCQTT